MSLKPFKKRAWRILRSEKTYKIYLGNLFPCNDLLRDSSGCEQMFRDIVGKSSSVHFGQILQREIKAG